MKCITLEQWDATSPEDRDRLLREGAYLSYADTTRLAERLMRTPIEKLSTNASKPEPT